MSVSNRILLNRHIVTGRRTVEVLLLHRFGEGASVATAIRNVSGRIVRSEEAIGYVRAELPLEEVAHVTAMATVDAYQIASLSKGAWYRDGPPEANAAMFRGYEMAPIGSSPKPPHTDLPILTTTAARAAGYSADDGTGVAAWLREHPTFDGRGVTIALLESAQPEWTHLTLRTATTLDGRIIPKIAGVMNNIAEDMPDETRVALDESVESSAGTWSLIGGRTYILPGPGSYRFGRFRLPAGDGVIHEYGVLRDRNSAAVRVDANANGDFRDDPPIADINNRLDVRTLRVTHPYRLDLPFVFGNGRRDDLVHLYVASSGHQTMTASVAAGSVTDDDPAYGVAPGARVLFVRSASTAGSLRDFVEAHLDAAARPDVDILCSSTGISMVPDVAADFVGLFFSRLIAAFDKPIFQAAGNLILLLNNVNAFGDAFAVGGSLSPATFDALYGSGTIASTMVHPLSAGGPSLDGALKPDFLAPMQRLAASVQAGGEELRLPASRPAARTTPGHEISCCTSASSPYAAGMAALLISAAKQEGVPYSVPKLRQALQGGARFLPGWPSYLQGAGELNVGAAWTELARLPEPPRIRVSGSVVHPLSSYSEGGTAGTGIFERSGWRVGDRGVRMLRFIRDSGPNATVAYRLSWTGNDGTFTAPTYLSLSLAEERSIELAVTVKAAGVHSAVLNLHDEETHAIVRRVQVTIVAASAFDTRSGAVRFGGSLPLMETAAHYVAVPPGAGALSLTLRVTRGSVLALVLPGHGLNREYYGHVTPQAGRAFGVGTYHLVMPAPGEGTWSINVSNSAAWWSPRDADKTSPDAAYTLTAELLQGSLTARSGPDDTWRVSAANDGASLQEAALDVSAGFRALHHESLPGSGLPSIVDVNVPQGTHSLRLRASSIQALSALEMYLYDCTSGECFSYDFTLPAVSEPQLTVYRPSPGRWKVAVSAGSNLSGPFLLESIVTGPPRRSATQRSLAHGQRGEWLDLTHGRRPDGPASAEPVIVADLVDVAQERKASRHPWEVRKTLVNFADTPTPVATAIFSTPSGRRSP